MTPSHVVPPLLCGQISKCEFLPQIECQTIGINAKNQDLVPFGLSSDQRGTLEKFQKPRFAKGGPHGSCGPPCAIGTDFDVWISPANRVPNSRISQRLAIADMIREVSKRRRSLVLQRGTT